MLRVAKPRAIVGSPIALAIQQVAPALAGPKRGAAAAQSVGQRRLKPSIAGSGALLGANRSPLGWDWGRGASERASGRVVELPFHQVDAFTARPFGGNPAAVVQITPSDLVLPDGVLTKIAAENNLSETAYFSQRAGGDGYDLRWFTPRLEVDLCGHATLATAHVIYQSGASGDVLSFHTRSGVLKTTRTSDGMITMDLPAFEKESMPHLIQGVRDAVHHAPTEVLWSESQRHAIALFPKARTIQELNPDLELMKKLPFGGLICTAAAETPADGGSCDFVYRYFAPKSGINEDPATGSAQCSLLPFWAPRLGKHVLMSQQLSARGAEFTSVLQQGPDGSWQVLVSGAAVSVIKGTITVPCE